MKVSASIDDDRLTLEMIDCHGPGINPETIAQIVQHVLQMLKEQQTNG